MNKQTHHRHRLRFVLCLALVAGAGGLTGAFLSQMLWMITILALDVSTTMVTFIINGHRLVQAVASLQEALLYGGVAVGAIAGLTFGMEMRNEKRD